MKKEDIKQFKLANGDEIVCEIIQYPDEESADLVVRNSYRIMMMASAPNGNHYYAFRPWMIYQDDPEMYQIVNVNHIVGEATPSQTVLDYYFKNVNFDDEAAEEASEKLKEFLQGLIDEAQHSLAEPLDSDNPNVLVFKPKNHRIH